MSQSEEQYNKSRFKTSYISTVVSITLVLYLLGLACVILLNAKMLSNYFRENIIVRVIMKEEATLADIQNLQQQLKTANYTKTVEYITKEKAAADLQKELGDDFISLLGYNPLLPSLDLRVKAGYANDQGFKNIETELKKNEKVKEVFYHKSLLNLVNENVRKISLFLLGFSLILFFIAFALINNTIRLAVYSKRFLIKSMLLVGAKQGFINRPFMLNGIVQGIIGSLIAIALLEASQYFFIQQMPDLKALQDTKMTLLLFSVVVFLGVFISWISTFFAVKKYLRLKTDYLYFY